MATWTDKEKAKQKDGNSVSGKVVRDSEGKLLQEGFTGKFVPFLQRRYEPISTILLIP